MKRLQMRYLVLSLAIVVAQPGEFKFLNQGVVLVENLLVPFTILTNDGQDAVVTAALAMLSAAEKR